MTETSQPSLTELVRKIGRYGKENLTDILHDITVAVRLVTNRNRCRICGRPRGYMRKFQLCRICFRNLALDGSLPGVIKASW